MAYLSSAAWPLIDSPAASSPARQPTKDGISSIRRPNTAFSRVYTLALYALLIALAAKGQGYLGVSDSAEPIGSLLRLALSLSAIDLNFAMQGGTLGGG
ncbi:MAG: hypothetical protein KGL31_01295, partial [candidate division NC10 bacterium]|nr:hypothetical protein [candidate division NC10 bacterium]